MGGPYVNGQLELAVLGKPQLKREGKFLADLLPVKGQALLIYLAVTRQTYSRSALAGLLWGDMPEEVARSNLRLTLSRLRGLADDYLVITRQSVSFNFDRPHWLDVAYFETHTSAPERSQIDHLQAAVSLYRGDFLTDFWTPNAPDFEAWAILERERLRQLAIKALFYLAREAQQREALAEGIEVIRRILALEPWLEEAHYHLIWLLARSGQRGAALVQYELCRRALVEELGVEPAPATLELYSQLKEGSFEPLNGAAITRPETASQHNLAKNSTLETGANVAALPSLLIQTELLSHGWNRPPIPRHNLPPQLTPFIGRETELAQIAELLANPACRLLTLVGPGGVGKTRLALAAAEAQIEAFRDGVRVVSLAGVRPARMDEAVDLLLINIAAVLDYTFTAPQPPRDLLFNHLAEQEILLLLDNFEQLLAPLPGETGTAAQFLLEVLHHAPGLKFLITSRERLGLKAEWVLDVTGLPYPSTTLSEAAADYPAIELFVQNAQRIKPDFDLASEAGAVRHICQFVQGHPLCLELAAHWVRRLPCYEIAAKIEHDLDILSTTATDVADRHRSMRSVFDQTWTLLSEAEQQVFRRLSVFQNGLEREAAEQIAEASLPVLAGLVEKSLLRCTDEGRYELHELVRQYGAERLAMVPVEEAETRQKHSRYYADFLEKRRLSIENRPNPAAMAEIDQELSNIRAAWEELLAQKKIETIAVFLEGLWRFYQQTGWFQEAVLVLKQACTLAETSSLQQACWQRRLGEAHYQLGQWAESKEYLERALALLGHPLPKTEMGWRLLSVRQLLRQGWHRLGSSRLRGQKTEKRRSLLEAALALRRFGQFVYFDGDKLRLATSALYCLNLAEQAGASPELAEAYVICGITTGTIRLHRLARHYSNLALQTAQNMDKLSARAYVSQVAGLYYCGICRWVEAEELFEQAANLFGQLEWRHSWAECTSLLGKVCYYQGKFSQSQQYYANLFQAAQYHGNLAAQHWGLVGQAECALRLGQPSLEQVGAWLERANALPANYPEYTQQVRLYGFLALTHLYQGNWSSAQQAAQTGAQFIRRSGFMTFWAIEGYAGVAETFLTLWENNLTGGHAVTGTEFLAKAAQQACQALHRFARTYPLGQPRAWLYQGLYEWLAGRADRAYEAWGKSLTTAQRLGMPYEQGRAHFELGRRLPSKQSAKDGLSSQEHLQQAANIFAQLGAVYDLEQVNTVLTYPFSAQQT
ncbi:MAG: hypothetical protein HS126_24560 [Anaerolineales bacterium]|nr:hypothetical protein [Anaerolineales bacterium]